MRCFTVYHSSIQNGISFSRRPYAHVPVGESGPGRLLAMFPVSRSFASRLAETTTSIERASILKTHEDGALWLVEPQGHDKRAIVHVRVTAGLRGTTVISGASYTMVPCPRRGQQISAVTCDACGAGIRAAGWAKRHPDAGSVPKWSSFPPKGVTPLAEGYCARGDAGHMGGHCELLLLMEPGSAIRVLRQGRLLGRPAQRIVEWTGVEIRLGVAGRFQKSLAQRSRSCHYEAGELI